MYYFRVFSSRGFHCRICGLVPTRNSVHRQRQIRWTISENNTILYGFPDASTRVLDQYLIYIIYIYFTNIPLRASPVLACRGRKFHDRPKHSPKRDPEPSHLSPEDNNKSFNLATPVHPSLSALHNHQTPSSAGRHCLQIGPSPSSLHLSGVFFALDTLVFQRRQPPAPSQGLSLISIRHL